MCPISLFGALANRLVGQNREQENISIENRFGVALVSLFVMSLVGKYSRRDDDEEEEAPTPTKMAVVEEEAPKKKRDATDEVDAPEPKRAKLQEPESDKLELPDFFKTDTTPKVPASAALTSKSNILESKPVKLVPRQLRYVKHP